MTHRGAFLYEGKAKRIYRTDDPGLYWVEFKDDATAFDGRKKGSIAAKGVVNTQVSAMLFRYLEDHGIPTHLVGLLGEREFLARAVTIIPVEVVARNVIAGSLAKRLGRAEGEDLPQPVLEFYYKSDELGDPMVNEYHIEAMGWATPIELKTIKDLAWRVNELLRPRLLEAGLILVDFKLEFGRDAAGQVILADEISPDTCRLWDVTTREKLDKDRFRRDLGGVEDAYQEVLKRLQGVGAEG